MELIAVHQIVTREKKGGPRVVIPANSRFDPADYPMISEREWQAMMSGEHQVVRTPDDPAFAVPSPSLASEGRSPRSDVGPGAAAMIAAKALAKDLPVVEETAESIAADEEARRQRLAENPPEKPEPLGRRGRAARKVEEDDDEV